MNASEDVDKLCAIIASLTGKNSYLEDCVRLLKKELFGRKAEKLSREDARQMRLFDEAEAVGAAASESFTVSSRRQRPTD